MSTHLYAEHLPRIHALSIQVSLLTPANTNTKASISADGDSFTLSHDGQETRIDLPVVVAGGVGGIDLPITPLKTSLEFRIPLGADSASTGMITPAEVDDDLVVPWTAISLSQSTEVSCGACGTILITRGRIQSWRDLPSENWAEMMDLWHCHKPDEPHSHDHEHEASRKGYAATSTLTVTSGICFVDPVSFLVDDDDCQYIKVGL